MVVNTACISGQPSSITFGAQNLTKVRSDVAGVVSLDIWYLIGPTAGTATITVTCSAGTVAASGVSVSMFGALQSSQPNASALSAANNTSVVSISTTVTTTVPGCWIIDNVIDAVSRISCGWTPTSPQVMLGCNGAGNASSVLKDADEAASFTLTETHPSSALSWGSAAAWRPSNFVFGPRATMMGFGV